MKLSEMLRNCKLVELDKQFNLQFLGENGGRLINNVQILETIEQLENKLELESNEELSIGE